MNTAVVQRIQHITETISVCVEGEWTETEIEKTTKEIVGVYALDGGFNPQVFHRAVSEETGVPYDELHSTLMVVDEALHSSLKDL
jgi:hypothetical protein